MLAAACGLAFINGYHRQRPPAERLEVVKLTVELGEDITTPAAPYLPYQNCIKTLSAVTLGDPKSAKADPQAVNKTEN